MRSFHPGRVAVPVILLMAGMLLTMDRLNIIQVTRVWNLWPVVLIAAGVEELYIWAVTGDDR